MNSSLTLQAGPAAMRILRERGLRPEDIQVIAGAAGGPKWLVLSGLDRLIFGTWLQERTAPLFLVGSSIGAWRFAALSRRQPVQTLDRFEAAYIHQRYASKPTAQEVSRESRKIMEEFLDEAGIREILDHPFKRLNIFSARCHGLLGSDARVPLAVGLAGAALANLCQRRLLSIFFRQTLFSDPRQSPPFQTGKGFAPLQVRLTEENFRQALLASGSIPLVMSRVSDIPGAPPGTYRDGGILDYHLDIPFGVKGNGLVLFPHYSQRITPGWFDKKLIWRKPHPGHMDHVLLVSPSKQFVADLPFAKIPDRNDFWRFKRDDLGRIDYWQTVSRRSRQLADELVELVERGCVAEKVKPFGIEYRTP
ncbi:MAG: patatin-like phospholipase family protein [Desulfobacteraceae bacterium]|nr:patatin-like phospholipase family protein [Desulfobacteraceae bacterium]